MDFYHGKESVRVSFRGMYAVEKPVDMLNCNVPWALEREEMDYLRKVSSKLMLANRDFTECPKTALENWTYHFLDELPKRLRDTIPEVIAEECFAA